MKRWSLLLALGGLLGVLLPAASVRPVEAAGALPKLTAPEIFARGKRLAVSITTTTAKGRFDGSGFLWSFHCVVTNYHVIAGGSRIEVKAPDGATCDAKNIIWADQEKDLAIVEMDKRDWDHFELPGGFVSYLEPPAHTRVVLPVGATVYVLGNPAGLEKTLSSGMVSGIRSTADFHALYQITAPISPGSSGSPVFDEYGRIAGVVRGYLKDGQSLNFAEPISYIGPDAVSSAHLAMPVAEWAKKTAPKE